MKRVALVAPELKALFQPQDFAGSTSAIAAVSGGGDSMALLAILHDYLKKQENPPHLVAITVDHGLRAESAGEARRVAAFCAAQGIAHEVAHWQGEKPKTGLMAQARLARYQLLYERARFHGAQVIFTGHNFDDVAETYLMRAARVHKSPQEEILPRGLAAMSRKSLLCNEIALIRPLLAMRRAALRQFLVQRNIGWIDDPSNEDSRFERVRLRQSLDETTLIAAVRAASEATQQRYHYNTCALNFLQTCPIQRLGEAYQLDVSAWCDDTFLPQYIADLACLVGGANHLRPAPVPLRAFQPDNARTRFTWSGCVIERNGVRLRFWRERRNLPEVILAAQSDIIWDNRYHIINNGTEEMVIRPVLMNEVLFSARALNIPVQCLLAAPAIITKKGIEIPTINGGFVHNETVSLKRILAPYHFLQSEEECVLISHWNRIFNIVNVCEKP